MALFLVIVIGVAALVVYSMVEKRINQKSCPECGYRVSVGAPHGDCPRCRSGERESEFGEPASAPASGPSIRGVLRNWPRLVFIGVPLAMVVVSGGLLLSEHYQSDSDKAIRLVKESNSRKENFNVQQYLYATVFHRRSEGEQVTIAGWRVSVSPDKSSETTVDFVYSDADGEHVATWEASVSEGRVAPRNEAARELSWH